MPTLTDKYKINYVPLFEDIEQKGGYECVEGRRGGGLPQLRLNVSDAQVFGSFGGGVGSFGAEEGDFLVPDEIWRWVYELRLIKLSLMHALS